MKETINLNKEDYNNFWEAFKYLESIGYEDYNALMISMVISDGGVWGNVIDTKQEIDSEGHLDVEIYFLNKDINQSYKPIYKSYIKIKKYQPIKALDDTMTKINLKLKTQLTIEFFNDGIKNI